MVLQNIIFPDDICSDEEIYFRLGEGSKLNKGVIEVPAGSSVNTNTYMNAFDIGNWQKETEIDTFFLRITFKGKGRLVIKYLIKNESKYTVRVAIDEVIESNVLKELHFFLPSYSYNDVCYWEFLAEESSVLENGNYYTEMAPFRTDIRLAVDICTFHRERQLYNNLEKFTQSYFFQQCAEMYGAIQIFVIDNGNSFPNKSFHPFIHIYQNTNKGGGSGGFTRGLKEIKNMQRNCKFSHVVFMDDDVEFQMECFYRLFSWLSYLKKENQMISIAGRMFRLDKREVQYTAVEVWNEGDIYHRGGSLDMRLEKNALYSSVINGDYGGWWFCTYPVEFALENCPFPFFIHCDDVEYGLRFPGQVIALRGVQVWHQTYEYRVTPQIIYYDIRNPMVVNTLHGDKNTVDKMILKWRECLNKYHSEENQMMKYLCILAMYHYLKGYRFFKKGGKLSRIHEWIKEQTGILKIINPLFRRYTEHVLKFKNVVENVSKQKKQLKKNTRN